jgi:hypothetical protein
MELAGSAVHALANLAIGNGSDHAKFTAFLNAYLPMFARANFPERLYSVRLLGAKTEIPVDVCLKRI